MKWSSQTSLKSYSAWRSISLSLDISVSVVNSLKRLGWLSFMYYCFNPLVINIFKYHSNRLCSWNYPFACFVFLCDIHNASYKKELCMLLQSSFHKHLLFVKNCIKYEIAHTLLIQSLRPMLF